MPDYKYDTTAYKQWSQENQFADPMTRYRAAVNEFGVGGLMEANPALFDPAYKALYDP